MSLVTESTRDAPAGGIVGTAREIADRATTLARLRVELAQLEVKRKLTRTAIGAGLAAGAALLLLFAIGFLLAAGAAGLAHAVSMWLALLIVALALLLVTGVLALLAVRSFKGGGDDR